jgi:hypothetical protein
MFLTAQVAISLTAFFGPNILLSAPFSNTFILCYFLTVRDQVPHPYTSAGKIRVLYYYKFSASGKRHTSISQIHTMAMKVFIFKSVWLPCSGTENREYGRGDPLRWPRDNFTPQKLALTSPTSSGRSVGIVRSRNKATESSLVSGISCFEWT